MERRSLFSKIFGTTKNVQYGQALQMLNGYKATFTDYNGKIWNDSEVRACVDAIARNGAKLSPKHIRKSASKFEQMDASIQRMISEQPNELMNAYDFYYKVIATLKLSHNAFIYIQRDENNKPTGLYPIRSDQYQLMEYNDDIYITFRFRTGKVYTASLQDVIHLKEHFVDDDILGGSNDPIVKTMSIKHIVKEGMVNAIKTTQSIRGYIKSTKTMLKPSDVKQMRDQFVNDFMDDNESGIGGLDATLDFTPINLNPKTADEYQLKEINDEIKNYFGVNENILQSKFSEDEWNAFYESVLEPIGIMMSLEFTNKLFTRTERGFGNKIVFESNRLQYASNETKIKLVQSMREFMTMNEIREVFNLAPREDGDKILQSLNYVDSSIANKYQTGE